MPDPEAIIQAQALSLIQCAAAVKREAGMERARAAKALVDSPMIRLHANMDIGVDRDAESKAMALKHSRLKAMYSKVGADVSVRPPVPPKEEFQFIPPVQADHLKRYVIFNKNSTAIKCGVSAHYFPINGIGVKYFRTSRIRDIVMKRQQNAAILSLAPWVYKKCEVWVAVRAYRDGRHRDSDSDYMELHYGYETEAAGHCSWDKLEVRGKQQLEDQIEDEFGTNASDDLHASNMGWVRRGVKGERTLVCIDWGWDNVPVCKQPEYTNYNHYD